MPVVRKGNSATPLGEKDWDILRGRDRSCLWNFCCSIVLVVHKLMLFATEPNVLNEMLPDICVDNKNKTSGD